MSVYKLRIVNKMHGYERDQIIEIEARSEAQALAKGYAIDCFAEVKIL